MLKVTNLKIEFSSLIFQNVNFILGNKEKVGLVGLNGCGKSTLLKILNKEIEADEGGISMVNEVIGYLPQEFDFNQNILVGEYLESLITDIYSEMWKVDIALSKLGLKLVNVDNVVNDPQLLPIDFYSSINDLSEGQKLKLYLCKLLLQESTILLLDEPTNHLDIEGIKWMEGFCRDFDGVIITISHDRLFLNNVVDQIFEIDEGRLNIFPGNYDDYKIQKEDWKLKRQQDYVLQEKKREQLDDLLRKARALKDPNKRSAAVNAAKMRMKREVENKEIDKYKEKKLKGLSLEGTSHKSKTMLEISDLNFSYGEKEIISNSNFDIYGGDKVWFYGPNGIGKSTLIKLITGHLSPNQGKAKIGDNVNWAYFSQDQSHLPAETTVRDFIMQVGKIEYTRSFGVLEKFLFPKELQNFELSTLSPGQRARLSFAVFTLQNNDLLILDEPTNHLDIETKETIEKTLYEYEGTLLVISHDRYFVEQIGINRKFTLSDGKIVE